MSVILRSGSFAAKVREKGAELASLADLSTGREYIWNGDPAWWTGSAPVLFPIVGALRDGSYTFEGRRYSLSNHGFARHSEFTIVEEHENAAQLELSSGPSTLDVYPFDFALRVGFTLDQGVLSVGYRVTNTGARRMYFSIGSHPAFVVPFAGGSLENYYVLFDREESAERWFIRDNLIVADTTERAFTTRRTIDLSRTLFDRGALVFKHLQSHEFSLRTSLAPQAVTVSTDGAPYFGIWSKPGAAFVCLEPWHGIADNTKATGRLEEKEGILFLDPQASFSTGYRIAIT